MRRLRHTALPCIILNDIAYIHTKQLLIYCNEQYLFNNKKLCLFGPREYFHIYDDTKIDTSTNLSVCRSHRYRAAVISQVMRYVWAEHVSIADLERLHERVLYVSLEREHVL